MTIRKADKADLDLLRGLWDEFQAEVDQYREHADPEPDLEHYVTDDVALVAEEDGGPVGFALARRRDDVVGYLNSVYVRPAFRRRGVGRELMAAASAALGSECSRSSSTSATRRRGRPTGGSASATRRCA